MRKITLDGTNHPYSQGGIIQFDGIQNTIEEIETVMSGGKPDMTALYIKPVQSFVIKSSDVLKVESL